LSKDDVDEIFETITSEGMIHIAHKWIPIEIEVEPIRDTEKSYFGRVTVYEIVNGSQEMLFEDEESWIPKTMADNPWWICTIKFEHLGKVSNKKFEVDDYY